MNKVLALVGCLLLASGGAWAQSGEKLDMDLDRFEEQADEVVSVDLEGKLLEAGSKLLEVRKGVTEPVKQLVKGLKAIHLRRFWFGGDKGYKPEDVEPVRRQIEGRGWVPVIEVKDRNKTEAVTVYSYTEGEQMRGVTVVSAEPREFTVVRLLGEVDLETLSNLEGQFGLPNFPTTLNLATRELPGKSKSSQTKEAQSSTAR